MWKLYLLVLVALSEKMLAQTSKVVAQFDTTPLEYLDMSDLAYTEQDWDEKPEHQALLALGWQSSIPSGKTNFLRKGKGGYRGIVYVHEDRKEIVCAHRGTASLDALIADATLVVEQKVHAQVAEAVEVCLDKKIRNFLSQGYSLTFVGHSLGGFLATASLYFCQRTDLSSSQGESFHYTNSKAVVFDPAGSQEFLLAMEPHAVSHARLGEEGIKNLNALHFVSLPNYVNAFAPQPGGTIYALFPQNLTLDTINPVTYLRETHSLERLRTCFWSLDSSDPRAGYPKAAQCKKMSDWPLIDLSDLASATTVIGALSAPLRLATDVLQALAAKVGYRSQRTSYIERLGGGEEYRQALLLATQAAKNANGVFPMPELMAILSSHYVSQHSFYDVSLHHLHFGKCLSEFLNDYALYLHNTPSTFSFSQDHTLAQDDLSLLSSYRITERGDIYLTGDMSIFTFRYKIARLFLQKNLTADCVTTWIKLRIGTVPEDIESIKERLNKVEQRRSAGAVQAPTLAFFSGIAEAENSNIKVKNKLTTEQAAKAQDDFKELASQNANANRYFGSAVSNQRGSSVEMDNDFTVDSQGDSAALKK